MSGLQTQGLGCQPRVRVGALQRVEVVRCAELERELFPGDDPWSAQAFLAELDLGYFYLAARLDTAAARLDTPAARLDTAVVDIGQQQGELVGYAGLALVGRPPELDAEVHTIGVDSRYQGRGIGRLLLRTLLAHADAHQADTFLEVRTDNEAAIALYRSEDFEVIGTRRRYYRLSGADAYTMRRPAAGRNGGGQDT